VLKFKPDDALIASKISQVVKENIDVDMICLDTNAPTNAPNTPVSAPVKMSLPVPHQATF
jgi:hypothetical protein